MWDERAAPLSTVLVWGPPSQGPSRLVQDWAAQQPADARWAWLACTTQAQVTSWPGATQGPGRLEYLEIAGGCACCVGRHTLAQALVRLLRAGPWDGLVLEARGAVHAAGLTDVLQSAPFARFFDLLPPVAVSPALPDAPPAVAAPPSALEWAPIVVLPAVDPATAHPWRQTLIDGPVAQRTVFETDDGRVPWAQLGAEWARRAAAAQRTAWLEPRADGLSYGWRWAAPQRFDRRRLWAVLAGLCAPGGAASAGGLRGARGAFRTARAWYRWHWQGSEAWIQETAWRVDNRLELVVALPIDPHIVEVAVQSAFEGPAMADVADA